MVELVDVNLTLVELEAKLHITNALINNLIIMIKNQSVVLVF